MRKAALSTLLVLCILTVTAQDSTLSLTSKVQYEQTHKPWGIIDPESNIRVTNLVAPALFISYGLIGLNNHALRTLNFSTKTEIKEDHPYFRSHLDNYLQFTPAAAAFALQMSGIRGKNKPAKEAAVFLTSLAISAMLIQPLKSWTHELRPDNSNRKSFPSGHTTTAFVGAEFLRIEYGKVSPWIAIGGYAAATATGILRVYNNKHWVSDVIAGAGFGILSTDLGYWINDRFFWKNKKENKTLSFFPVYQNGGNIGLGLIKTF